MANMVAARMSDHRLLLTMLDTSNYCLVLVVIPVHIFTFVIMVNYQFFVLSNVFSVGNMLNV